MSSDLRSKVIRLAATNAALRSHLLPILAETDAEVESEKTAADKQMDEKELYEALVKQGLKEPHVAGMGWTFLVKGLSSSMAAAIVGTNGWEVSSARAAMSVIDDAIAALKAWRDEITPMLKKQDRTK
jgi:hypothetical protein